MDRRKFIHNSTLTFGALTLAQQKIFSNLIHKRKWSRSPHHGCFICLLKKVGVFTERGGTIAFLLDKKGIVVVDSQFPDTAPHLIGELHKSSEAPIKYLLNTHHHGDHSGGNIAFKGLVKHVVAHENSKEESKTSCYCK